jgi:hypothetical protein
VVAGSAGVSDVLGYPVCCEIRSSEEKPGVAQADVQVIIDTHHPPTSDDIVALWKGGAKVQIAIDPDADILHTGRSLRSFSYIQFIACPACRDSRDSAAAQVNGRMRDLAFRLSPSCGRRIRQARDLLPHKGRPIAVGCNDLCPCGGGSTFKKCCARIDPR